MKSIGRYEILKEIGRGGMGIVYLARQHGLDRLVALKELHVIHASAPDIVQRFVRESHLAGSLNHRNIVTVHDYVEEDGTPYIAMEYMPRGSLRPWVGSLSLAQLAGVLDGLLAGLAAVEPSGIVHRDLKPENVMVAADGGVKIADFGVAKTTQSAGVASFMTATGTTVGTPAYMAPEQALSQEIGPWTDLYSVGVMTYEQLVGHLPFNDSTIPMAILLRHVNDPIPPVLDSRPDLDPALSEWVGRLLLKEPSERTRSAAQAWEELEEIILELLGPRWRRDALLPARDSSSKNPEPPMPAPLESHRARAPREASSGPPEIESGFLSYGRALTGASPSQPAPPKERSLEPPVSAHGEDLAESAPRAPLRTGAASRPRVRSLGAVALLAVLTAAGGYALAPSGKTASSSSRTGKSSELALASAPARAYAVTLSNVMSKLNSERSTDGSRLARAATAHAQATAAQMLAQAHEHAAAALRSAPVSPPARAANTAIASALAEIGRGYSTMANAARREDRHGFDSGRSAVRSATASLSAAFAVLHRLGYPLDG